MVLVGIYGDMPARIELAKTLGIGAYLPCHWCVSNAINVTDRKRKREDKDVPYEYISDEDAG